MVQYGLSIDGYNYKADIGWHHLALVQIACSHGVKSTSKKYMPISELFFYLSEDNYAIASIESKTGGHLILIYGYDIKWIYYHDPYTKGSMKMDLARFKKNFTNKAIITKKI